MFISYPATVLSGQSDTCSFPFVVKGLSTYIFSNKISLVLNDTPRRDSNCPNFSQTLGEMGFQGIPNMFGHSCEQPVQKSSFNLQIMRKQPDSQKKTNRQVYAKRHCQEKLLPTAEFNSLSWLPLLPLDISLPEQFSSRYEQFLLTTSILPPHLPDQNVL